MSMPYFRTVLQIMCIPPNPDCFIKWTPSFGSVYRMCLPPFKIAYVPDTLLLLHVTPSLDNPLHCLSTPNTGGGFSLGTVINAV